jgi:hypothetical protein
MAVCTTKKEINRYKKLKIKRAFIRQDIAFLLRCKRRGVFPKFINNGIRSGSKGWRVDKAIFEAKRRWLSMEINNHFMREERIGRELYCLHQKLTYILDAITWQTLDEGLRDVLHWKLTKKCRTLNGKFRRLTTSEDEDKRENISGERNFVINKSSRIFTEKELTMLNKGLKYKPRPDRYPVDEIVVAMESSIKFAPIEKQVEVRQMLTKTIKETRIKPKESKEMEIVKEIKKADCVFLAPDKGKGVVIVDKKEYRRAALEHLHTENYEVIKSRRKFKVDSLQELVVKGLNEMKNEGLLSGKEVRRLRVPNPVIPSFSCLPKIHKEGNKYRPVVSNIDSPTSKICDYLVEKIRGLKKPFSMSVKNSFELANVLKQEKILDNEMLVSFDVEALYPSVPVKEAFELFTEWINEQDISDIDAQQYIKLMRLVLDQRWLEFEGEVFKQKEGLFIGNALSPILAEIFMGKMEEKISQRSWFPRFWRRYVDDILAIVEKDSDQKLLSELNSQHTALKFTVELEKEDSISFLDLWIKKNGDGFVFDIFRKPTDAPLCIPADSYHPWKHKIAAFESAIFRMWNFPLGNEQREKEMKYLREMARLNGYKRSIIDNLNEKYKKKHERKALTTLIPLKYEERREKLGQNKMTKKREVKNVVLPYACFFTDRLEKRLRPLGYNVCYQTKGTLRNLIGRTKKGRSGKECSGIYNIACRNCPGNYIGQTKRRIATREEEHDRHTRLKQVDKSSVAAHCVDLRHERGECEILKVVNKAQELDAWESLSIARGKDLVNTADPPIRSKLFNWMKLKSS